MTRASRGIGLGIAKGFYHEGCSVVSNGRNEFDSTSSIGKRKGWTGVTGDVTDPNMAYELVQKAVELMGVSMFWFAMLVADDRFPQVKRL